MDCVGGCGDADAAFPRPRRFWCARRRRVAMTTIARARGGDAVVSIATSSRRRCRRWSVSTRARREISAEKLRDEGAGEDEGDARAGSGDDACACGSGETYERCCGVMHRGKGPIAIRSATMRARFTAYARGRRSRTRDVEARDVSRSRARVLARGREENYKKRVVSYVYAQTVDAG